jgi:hypothetical protein
LVDNLDNCANGARVAGDCLSSSAISTNNRGSLAATWLEKHYAKRKVISGTFSADLLGKELSPSCLIYLRKQYVWAET